LIWSFPAVREACWTAWDFLALGLLGVAAAAAAAAALLLRAVSPRRRQTIADWPLWLMRVVLGPASSVVAQAPLPPQAVSRVLTAPSPPP
jgi:beta-lactamase regulating signal transducer with metallopeptidase domain